MAAGSLITLTEQWIRDRLQLKHPRLGDVRSLGLPGTYNKIKHLGDALNNFVRLKSLDLSCNALVSVEGVQHLKMLERLVLYDNCIPSLKEVEVLFELPVLRELDLRLNPLTKTHPHYRPYVVQAIPSLHKLDSCSVRHTERQAAIVQFLSDHVPQQRSSSPHQVPSQRSRGQKLALVDHLTNKPSLLTDTDNIVLNFVATNHGGPSESQSLPDSVHKESALQSTHLQRQPMQEESKDVAHLASSAPDQENVKSIDKSAPTSCDKTEPAVPHMKEPSHKNSPISSNVTETPKVSFGPHVEKHRAVPVKQKPKHKQTRHPAMGHFIPNPDQGHPINIGPPSPHQHGLNLSDNPILHPPRPTCSNFNKTEQGSSMPQQVEKKKRGSYRKPLELLLSLVDKHLGGERSLHQNNNFLSQAVQILAMMESDISICEAKVRTLKQEVDALNCKAAAREEESKSEVHHLSAQLEESRSAVVKLNEQLRVVSEENVALLKQLKLERQILKSMMKSSLITQINEIQTEVKKLRKELKGLRAKVQEAEKAKGLTDVLQDSHRSQVATNECLTEMKGGEEH